MTVSALAIAIPGVQKAGKDSAAQYAQTQLLRQTARGGSRLLWHLQDATKKKKEGRGSPTGRKPKPLPPPPTSTTTAAMGIEPTPVTGSPRAGPPPLPLELQDQPEPPPDLPALARTSSFDWDEACAAIYENMTSTPTATTLSDISADNTETADITMTVNDLSLIHI